MLISFFYSFSAQIQTFSLPYRPLTKNISTTKDISKEPSTDPKLLIPNGSNFGAGDFVMTPDTIYQVTVSSHHPIQQAELNKIVENLPVLEAFKKDSKANEIRFVFVVPDDIFGEFKAQPFHTAGRNVQKVSPEYLKDVCQYVMKIDIGSERGLSQG
jgi:hypothetical protein